MKQTLIWAIILLLTIGSSQMTAKEKLKDEDITSKFASLVFRQELKNLKIIADTACIMRSEVETVTRLQIKMNNTDCLLYSLSGLECFVNLRELSLKRSLFSKTDSILLDLSGNPKLEVIEIQNYYVGEMLDVNHNKLLRVLKCVGCSLRGLDLRNNRRLEILDCSGNFLSKLDLHRNISLKEIVVNRQKERFQMDGDPRGGTLVQLILPDNRQLRDGVSKLICNGNSLESLDLSRLPYLKELNCRWCKLQSLDLSANLQLEIVNCAGNYIHALDFAHLKKLYSIVCGNQGGTGGGIMVEGNDYRQLKSLTLPEQTAEQDINYLKELDYSESDLSQPIDFRKFPHLNLLVCQSNGLSSIDVSGNKELEQLDCSGNIISSLDLKENIKLRSLDVCSTLITELNLLHNTNLESLMCDDDIDYRYKTKRFKGSLSLKIILSKEGFEKISFNKHRGTGAGRVEYQGKLRQLPGNAVRIILSTSSKYKVLP